VAEDVGLCVNYVW